MKALMQDVWKGQISNDKGAVIINVRPPDGWEVGIIENALMMDIMDAEDFQLKASQLDSTKDYYVYCRGGVRSVKSCHVLGSLGLNTTYNLLGAMMAWQGKTVLPKA